MRSITTYKAGMHMQGQQAIKINSGVIINYMQYSSQVHARFTSPYHALLMIYVHTHFTNLAVFAASTNCTITNLIGSLCTVYHEEVGHI